MTAAPAPPSSMDSDQIFTGGCLCGEVRYEARGLPIHVNHCHCVQCQRSTGAAMATWATWLAAHIRYLKGRPSEYASSPGARRGFCAKCGSTLSWRAVDRTPAELDIAAGTLDQGDAISPREHLFVKNRRVWQPLSDGLPAYVEKRQKG